VQECFLTVQILLDFISWLETAVYFYRECFLTVELLLDFILLQIELQLNFVQCASLNMRVTSLDFFSVYRELVTHIFTGIAKFRIAET
jgi:hypothetical protein